jgi:hypothetical protein
MRDYTITYEGATICGERGFWFRLYHRNRLVAEGWSRGRKSLAEAEALEAINAREALHGAARKAS